MEKYQDKGKSVGREEVKDGKLKQIRVRRGKKRNECSRLKVRAAEERIQESGLLMKRRAVGE